MSRERLTVRLAAERKKKTPATVSDRDKERRQNGEMARNLDGFEYDQSKAVVLKKALHSINVSLGTLLVSMKDLAMLRGSQVTPDGLLGGRGFIMPFKDIKVKIISAINDLSDITDTIADELTNPGWGLSTEEKKKVRKEKQEIEEQVEEIEEVVPTTTPEAPVGEETPPPPAEVPMEDAAVPGIDDIGIGPNDVGDSGDIESLKRYSALLEGNVKDRVASLLSKQIVANLVKGEN